MLGNAGFNVVCINVRGVLVDLESQKLGLLDAYLDVPYAMRAICEDLCADCNCQKGKVSDEESTICLEANKSF